MNDRINNERSLLAFKNEVKNWYGKKYKLWAVIIVF